jgi:transposase
LETINREIRREKRDRAESFLDVHRKPKQNGNPQKFTWDEARKIRILYDSGKGSCRQLAKRFKCDHGTVHNIILGRGCYEFLGKRRARAKRDRVSEKEIDRIKFLEWEGWTNKEIAREVGRCEATISRVINNYHR